ncbi:unnamed protein product [Arctogadus glacialis]
MSEGRMADRSRHPEDDGYTDRRKRDATHETPKSEFDRDRTGREFHGSDVPHADRHGRDEAPSRGSRETPVFPFKEEYDDHRQALYNLRYILSSRGLCQILEVFVNLLLVICAGVPYSNKGGYVDLASLGSLYHYYYGGANAFTGTDIARVQELDGLFHRLKTPPYAFTMACGGALMAYACGLLALGVFRVFYRCPPLLLAEALLNALIALGYIPSLAFYFIKLKETYDSPVCEEREAMYAGKGHEGFKCQYNGADIAGGLFGVLGVAVFPVGAVLAIRAFRSVRQRRRSKELRDGPRPEERGNYV